MSSHAVSMELSVSFVSWINDQLREQIDQSHPRRQRPQVNVFRSFLCAGVASISIVLGIIVSH